MAALALAAALSLGLVRLGIVTARRAAAQATADATALAGAAEGRAAAAHLARVNGARLVSYGEDDAGVRVSVERSGVAARARARWVPASPDPSPTGTPTQRRGEGRAAATHLAHGGASG